VSGREHRASADLVQSGGMYPSYLPVNATDNRVRLTQDPDTGEQRWMLNDEESHLIGRVCDQIDRANPDLPIETCQAIARDIIRLVREYS
jgi:hypothetical protein